MKLSISANGEAFEELGSYDFKAKTEDKTTIRFDPRPARHVRITFLEQHPKQDKYPAETGFIRETGIAATPSRVFVMAEGVAAHGLDVKSGKEIWSSPKAAPVLLPQTSPSSQ